MVIDSELSMKGEIFPKRTKPNKLFDETIFPTKASIFGIERSVSFSKPDIFKVSNKL